MRERVEGRWVLNRRSGSCETPFGKVDVKQVLRPNGEFTIKVEHDELTRISIQNEVDINYVRNEIQLSLDTFVPREDWLF